LSRVDDNIRQIFGAVLPVILADYNSARMPAKYILVFVTIMGSWQEIIKKLGVTAYAGRDLGRLWAGTIKRF
jgi:hypothetical protein